MSVPVVSIIVPCYNYADYVADAIRSIKAQSLTNWECIIIDDASTDDSVSVIKHAIRGDKRFHLIQLPKKSGVSVARNAGLDRARGEYIGFLDADDCYTECALEMLVHLAKTMDAQIVGAQTMMVPTDFKYVPKNDKNWTLGKCWMESTPAKFVFVPRQYNWAWIWRRIYRRDLIKNVRFMPEFTGAGEDIAFMLDVCWRTSRVVETETITTYHRVHTKSLMQRPFEKSHFDFFPTLFRYIREDVVVKYPAGFLRILYTELFKYLILVTVISPKRLGIHQDDARVVAIESCRLIMRRYLPFRKRMLCWFLSCLK